MTKTADTGDGACSAADCSLRQAITVKLTTLGRGSYTAQFTPAGGSAAARKLKLGR